MSFVRESFIGFEKFCGELGDGRVEGRKVEVSEDEASPTGEDEFAEDGTAEAGGGSGY